jgi:hypothetical protein
MARRLFFLGFVTLFLELTLIRYLSGNIWNLGYFPNLVLTAVFVGMGLGFAFHHLVPERRSPVLFQGAHVVLLALVAFVYLKHPSVPGFTPWGGNVSGDLYFTAVPMTGSWQSYGPFFICGFAVVGTFALITQRTAKLFRRFPPLTAYTLDIAGSIAGILAFMVMSFFGVPAWAWFLVVGALAALTVDGPALHRLGPIAAAAATALVAYQQDQTNLYNPKYTGPLEVRWSPYQKVELADPLQIFVNGIGHQRMFPPAELRGMFYQTVHDQRRRDGAQPYRDVLILGAGSGNDVAAALANGADHVDAVEIDPAIARLGKLHHPARPYDDPRVTLTIDDGRAFMTRTERRYDLIVFALTDSLVKVSAMAQLRLENYLFTRESVGRAWSLLKDGGDVIFYNYYRQPWLRAKIEAMIAAATGCQADLVAQQDDFALLSVHKGAPPADPAEASAIDIPTDDWPFLYLHDRGIPILYGWAMAGMAAFVLLLMAVLHRSTRKLGAGQLLVKLAFVLMGVAFLLLETKGVIQFSLLFGTTWLNNSLVFLAVLVMVLAANWAARSSFLRGTASVPVIYVLLLASALVTLIYPLRELLQVASVPLRFLVASALTFSPIFFANLIFSITFRDQEVAEHVFGWNLIGATLGGVLEYTSMLLGYNLLAVLVAVCYTAVFVLLLLARSKKFAPHPAPPYRGNEETP